MNSALKLRSAPASGPWIVWIERESRARLASDAQITFVVLRQVRDGVGSGILPNLLPVPVGEQAYLPQISACGQAVEFELPQILTRRGLFAPQPGEPNVKRFECAHERFDLAQLAAACRLALIQNAKGGFLLSDGLPGKHID